MQEHEAESGSVMDADIHICIFPHLNEFMVLDVRDLQRPALRVVPVQELLTPQYYTEVEQRFSQMLRSAETPFINLMTLPERLQAFLRWKGIQNLTAMFQGSDSPQDGPRLSVFLCGGSLLDLGEEGLSRALDAFFEGALPSSFVEEYRATFRRLLQREQDWVKSAEMDDLRRAVEGQSTQFYTLWERAPGTDPGSL